jgi:spermidine/putrescine transport system substrate-binding protein
MRKWLFLFMFIYSCHLYAGQNILNVYNWSGYMPDDVLREFQQETGIQVNYSTYDSNETLYAKLKASKKANYDLIVPSTYFIQRMVKQGMLQRINKDKLPNFRHLNPFFLNKSFDQENHYSIPYLWNATGIAYNDQFFAEGEITRWADLWKSKFRNQLLLVDDVRDAFAVALFVLGYSPNDGDPQHIKEAYLKLKALLPNVKLFNTEAVSSIFIDEDATIGVTWNGNAYLAYRENPHIHFIYPKEGYVFALDSLAIPAGAQHVENAYKLINFLLRPEIAKKISLATGYATANLSATKMMSKEELNPIIYPDEATLARGSIQTDLGSANPIYEKYWELLKISG